MTNTEILVNRILFLAGKTQAQASRDVGVSLKTMSNWCNGKSSASLDTVIYMCDKYDIQVDIFLKED